MFPSWSQHVQGWTCSRDVLLETSVHWIFDQFQARGIKSTGNHRQFPRARHFCCSSSMMGGVARAELPHGKMLHYCTPAFPIIAPSDISWSAWATLHFQTIKCISKNVKGAVIEGNKIATTSILNCWFLDFFFPDCYLFSPPSRALGQRGMFSFKQRQRKRLPCLPVTLEHKELLCLYGRGSKGRVS